MGHQATVVIYLDALDTIAKDKDFGKNLAEAILNKTSDPNSDRKVRFNTSAAKQGVSSAGQVIEIHHSDLTVKVETGGNTGKILRKK